ncbi:MAG: hypothetical protein IT480_11110 [Gammaproteobacteria bacterium]|nr:hypothetical protein [Gammaproteobacteria bacterium]
MRRLAVYLTLLCVFAVALAIGWVLSDAPHYCARIGWCTSVAQQGGALR